MRKSQVMNQVLLPQAVKIMLPAIISQCVVALKDTASGLRVLAPGLTAIGKQVYGEFENQVQTVIVVAALYILINLSSRPGHVGRRSGSSGRRNRCRSRWWSTPTPRPGMTPGT